MTKSHPKSAKRNILSKDCGSSGNSMKDEYMGGLFFFV